ncbi:MAG: hypothetical protein QOF76_5333 [Solirubrobacteraceae bacterium]|jgi:ABC-type Zn uptake system ZnuABC Zn-binding protein ZnuA|nr:hypothetical protein [Solirubrobacteraceae bacterium]
MRSLLVPLVAACAFAWGVALAVGAVAGTSRAPLRGRLAVAATTTQVADMVRQVAGDRAQVAGLLAPNVDPHEHEVRPGDVDAVAAARVVFRSGGDVDAWMGDVERATGAEDRTVDLIAAVRAEGDDPHWWQDPRNGILAVAAIRRALTRADPAGAAVYARNAAAYTARLRAADRAIAACWAAVPAAQRQVVTTHDAYGYYARRYGLTLAGSVLGSLSSRAQPSARTLARLVERLRADDIHAIFPERALNPAVEQAVADEAGVAVGTPLQGDALARGQSYLEALAHDTRALVSGLTGRSCEVPVG